MKQAKFAAAVAVLLLTGVVLSWFLHGHSVKADTPAYKVVNATVQNAAQLEKLLNEQASGGWRYLSDIDRKLFIFERK